MSLAGLGAVAGVCVAAVRHRMPAIRGRDRPVRDARSGDDGDAFGAGELRGGRWDAALEGVTAPGIVARLPPAARTTTPLRKDDELREAEAETSHRHRQAG